MSQVSPPPNWYPDPSGGGGLRYWDGVAWTQHWAPMPPALPPPPFQGWAPLPWKGAQFGRPASGPGALADPGRRLGARVLDVLVLLPAFALILGVTLAIAAPHFGPIFPKVYANQTDEPVPVPGFLWIYLCVFGSVLATGLVMILYESMMTVRYGRTLGKAWLHIRPVQLDGTPLGPGRAFGRVAIYWLTGFASWLGVLDPLWCLWDDKRQCLHDKVAGTIVINDLTAVGGD